MTPSDLAPDAAKEAPVTLVAALLYVPMLGPLLFDASAGRTDVPPIVGQSVDLLRSFRQVYDLLSWGALLSRSGAPLTPEESDEAAVALHNFLRVIAPPPCSADGLQRLAAVLRAAAKPSDGGAETSKRVRQ